jgi:iron(III) transport system permease protein
MATKQSRALTFKKFLADPITILTMIVIFLFLFFFVAYPLAILLKDSFATKYQEFTFDSFAYIFGTLNYGAPIVHSLIIGVAVAFGATIVGVLFAYVEVYVKVRSPVMKWLFKIVSFLPLVSPPFLVAIAIILYFGDTGFITSGLFQLSMHHELYGYPGIIIVEIITFFPTVYLMVSGLLKNIDPSLEEAARDMGASRFKVFKDVTLPLLAPGITNAFLVTFIESVADFANPLIIGGSMETMSTAIYNQINGGNGFNGPYRASAMSLVLLVISMTVFFFQKYVFEKKTVATLTGKASRHRMLIEDKKVTIPLSIICSLISVFVIVLYGTVICCSFWVNLADYSFTWDNWAIVFSSDGLGSLGATMETSLIAAPLTALISMIIAYLVVKKRVPGKGIIEFVSMLAMAVPGTILGVGFIRGYVKGFFHTGWMQGLYGTVWIIIIVFIVRSLPIGTRSATASLRQIDKSIEESAFDMGANSLKVFTTVTLPLVRDSFFASIVTSFVRSVTAISAVILLVTPEFKLMTYVINEFAGKAAYPTASAYSTVLMVVSGVTIIAMDFVIKMFTRNRVPKEERTLCSGIKKKTQKTISSPQLKQKQKNTTMRH